MEKGVDLERVLNVNDLNTSEQSLETLRAGDIVTNFHDVKDLDLFFVRMANFIGEKPHVIYEHKWRTEEPKPRLTNAGDKNYLGWHTPSTLPSNKMLPKNFYGKIINITVLFVEDFNHQKSHMDGLNLVITADMVSTGRGKVGAISKLCNLRTVYPGTGHGNPYLKGCGSATYTNLPNDNAWAAAEFINKEAGLVAHNVVIAGLQYMISAGLPGSGKNA